MTTTTNNAGYLEIIIGPMFSGKTSALLDVYKKCKFCNSNWPLELMAIDGIYSNWF